VVPSDDRTKVHVSKLKYRKFYLNNKKTLFHCEVLWFFAVRFFKHWNGLPGEVVEPPFLEILKS